MLRTIPRILLPLILILLFVNCSSDNSSTPANQAPSVPSNPTPANNAREFPINTAFYWHCSDPDGDSLKFDIYYGTTSEPPLVISDRTDTTFIPIPQISNTVYYWKIVAKDNHGHEIAGPIWRFIGVAYEIVFSSDQNPAGLFMMHDDGTGIIHINNTMAHDNCPEWSPDGQKILFERTIDLSDYDICTISKSGQDLQNLTNDGGNSDIDPAWSPDGQKIAFARAPLSGIFDIYTINADGSNLHRLTYQFKAGSPDWSPDGTKIVFSADINNNEEIFVMNVDGSDQHNLTNCYDDDIQPSWSLDGQKIIFVSVRTGFPQIYSMNTDGSGLIKFSGDFDSDKLPTWSPDGGKIVYQRWDGQHSGIYIMNADGTGQHPITSGQHNDIHPTWWPIQ